MREEGSEKERTGEAYKIELWRMENDGERNAKRKDRGIYEEDGEWRRAREKKHR